MSEEKIEKKKVESKKKTVKVKKTGGAEVCATGRRKTATARVFLKRGSGQIIVNSHPFEEYFCKREVLISTVLRPLKELNVLGSFDIEATVLGGGVPSQADAMRMGIARALVAFNSENRKVLRSLDLLRRDPREKERKKYGLKRARRAFQYTKR